MKVLRIIHYGRLNRRIIVISILLEPTSWRCVCVDIKWYIAYTIFTELAYYIKFCNKTFVLPGHTLWQDLTHHFSACCDGSSSCERGAHVWQSWCRCNCLDYQWGLVRLLANIFYTAPNEYPTFWMGSVLDSCRLIQAWKSLATWTLVPLCAWSCLRLSLPSQSLVRPRGMRGWQDHQNFQHWPDTHLHFWWGSECVRPVRTVWYPVPPPPARFWSPAKTLFILHCL